VDFTHLLRPKSFDEMIGQEHLVSTGAPLRVLCEKGSLGHSFFFGPAGVGKTSLARIIASVMDMPFYEMNATSLKIEVKSFRSIKMPSKNHLYSSMRFTVSQKHNKKFSCL